MADSIGSIGKGIGNVGSLSWLASLKGNKRRKSRSRSKSRIRHTSVRKRNRFRKKKGQRYTPHTAGKRKDTSHKRIRYTRTGQPYVILASGKARFIKKKGAKSARKRRGGRY